MKSLLLTSLLSMTFLLTACGGGGSNGNTDDGTPNGGNDGNTSSPSVGLTGPFDLTEYLFHDNLGTVGGSHSYRTRLFKIEDGNELFASIEIIEEYFKQDENTVIQRYDNLSPPNYTYVITDTTIEETVHVIGDTNIQRTLTRSASTGDIYLDYVDGNDSAKCEVVKQFASFDLGNATGSFSLAAGIYNDVLQINCVTISEGSVLADFDQYFAKDVGLILTSGMLTGLGEVYLVPEF